MTKDAFIALVADLGALARKRPRLYRLRVMLLTLAGYSYLWFVVSVLLGVCTAAAFFQLKHGYSHATSKLAIAGLALAVPALRALAKSMPPPEGQAVSRTEVPLLFKDLDELSRSLGARRVNRVFLDTHFNAGVEQYPRLGVLGWSLNCLHVGVPLLLALDPTGMRAVLAHELGHLASRHGKLGAWIYRTNSAWLRLLEHFERHKRWGTGIFSRFFSWYAPYFDAFTFVLRREQEYEADRCAALLTSDRQVAQTLITVELRQRLLDEHFWPNVTAQFKEVPQPPEDVYEQMRQLAAAPLPHGERHGWLQDALAIVTAYNDSHPSLAERLKALGCAEEAGAGQQTSPPSRTAAQHYLGDRLASVLERFSHDWALEVAGEWRERYASFQADRAKLSELERKAQTSNLSDEEAWLQSKITESIEGPEAALPLLEALVRRSPAHASANFALGRLLLERGNHAGLHHLERVLEVDPDAAPACSRLACPHLAATGQTAKVDRYRHLAKEAEERRARVQAEISDITNTQTYRPHNLSSSELAALRAQLEAYPKLAAAYLVRRDLPSCPRDPHFVVGLAPRRTLGLWTNWVEAVALRDQICAAVEFPDDAKVILPRPVFRNAFEAMRRLSGTVVFERSKKSRDQLNR